MDFLLASTSTGSSLLPFILGNSDGDDLGLRLVIATIIIAVCMFLMGGQLLVQASRIGWDEAVLNNFPMDAVLDFICRNHKYRKLSNQNKRNFARDMIEILNRHTQALTAAGLDVAKLKADLTAQVDKGEAEPVSSVNPKAKVSAKEQAATDNAFRKANDSSKAIRLMMGANHESFQAAKKLFRKHMVPVFYQR